MNPQSDTLRNLLIAGGVILRSPFCGMASRGYSSRSHPADGSLQRSPRGAPAGGPIDAVSDGGGAPGTGDGHGRGGGVDRLQPAAASEALLTAAGSRSLRRTRRRRPWFMGGRPRHERSRQESCRTIAPIACDWHAVERRCVGRIRQRLPITPRNLDRPDRYRLLSLMAEGEDGSKQARSLAD